MNFYFKILMYLAFTVSILSSIAWIKAAIQYANEIRKNNYKDKKDEDLHYKIRLKYNFRKTEARTVNIICTGILIPYGAKPLLIWAFPEISNKSLWTYTLVSPLIIAFAGLIIYLIIKTLYDMFFGDGDMWAEFFDNYFLR